MKDNFWNNKIVMITGANGFLASHLSVYLLENKAKVIGLIKDKIPSFLYIRLKEAKYRNLKIIKGNIVNHTFDKRCFKTYKPHFCFHLELHVYLHPSNFLES